MRAQRIDGSAVLEGDTLTVDGNYPVTFVRAEFPDYGADETGEFYPGQIAVRWSWGAVEAINSDRAGVYVEATE